ncbi:hypothetical protein ACQKII_23640 [Lysinibacillus sp. NPDC048646]|uniref:hypothetical protein n=1 Tax=Lysinibacillus sp. NPDC048646 TaxID=3390574 RepID=UPI003D00A596
MQSKLYSSISRIDSSWSDFFTPTIHKCLLDIESRIGPDYVPLTNEVLKFTQVDLNNVNVVIFGRDPYPGLVNNTPIATGRAFEVRNYSSWTQPTKNASLRNIFKLLYMNKYQKKPAIKQMRKKISNGAFKLSPPNVWFTNMEANGVLWLNTALTCKENGDPGSHVEIWKEFSKELIKFIHKNNSQITYVLWGQSRVLRPQLKQLGVSDKKILESDHPSSTRNKQNTSFFKQNFISSIDNIKWLS